MDKSLKIIAGIILAGAVSASIAAMIMKKNGTLDKFIEKFQNKRKGGSGELDTDDVLENSICMISETFGDDDETKEKSSIDRSSHTAYDGHDLKPHKNGKR